MSTPDFAPQHDHLQPIGMTSTGQPIYPWPVTPPLVPQAPIKAHPWGTYIGVGCFGVLALAVVGTVIVAVVIGLSIALLVLAVAVVALTICVLVLRSMWRDYQREGKS
ncbi:hypothetical protein OR263_25570 [Streptomyces sp. NEAU-H22]|uniref:hypothetical protein n=1 Tax=Streptomyces sp. NEAU-H22 TaxID=2994655 RepID=UPI0022590D39|nr:hypothetical protein [Streptomyces sp. NEAU-H22]MCX3290040.1 hypothetical protein [Streptomyces sp. NEAU-H22]